MGAGTLKMVPGVLRPIVALFNPYLRRIRRHRRTAREILVPEIERRRANALQDVKETGEQREDMIEWLEEASSGDESAPERIADRQLGLSFAATHGTTNLIVNAVYDLAARWDEYGPELRREIEDAQGQDGGVMSKMTPSILSKLDSFIKESQRMNPGSARKPQCYMAWMLKQKADSASSTVSFNRKVKKQHVLTDGTVLQPSAYLAVASAPLAMSEAYHSDPTIFDGFRFHRLRTQSESSTSTAHQFTTTGPGSLMFGHGKHACPGRFFAGLEAKLIMAYLIRNFDLSLEPGVGRPPNFYLADANLTDPHRVIRLHRAK